MEELQKKFVERNCIDNQKFDEIERELGVNRKQISAWDQHPETKEYRDRINKVKRLYNNKKEAADKEGNSLFQFSGFRNFYEWYQKQEQKCHYCLTPAETLKQLFDKSYGKPVLSTQRLRGYSLEIDRKDSKTNIYSEANCVLACYFCNNHKSDIISEADFKQYFAPGIGKYLADKLAGTKTV